MDEWLTKWEMKAILAEHDRDPIAIDTSDASCCACPVCGYARCLLLALNAMEGCVEALKAGELWDEEGVLASMVETASRPEGERPEQSPIWTPNG